MPITQDRMIDLVHAAQDYEAALGHLLIMISNTAERAIQGKCTDREALEELALQAQAGAAVLLMTPLKSATTIAVEARHFKLKHRRNEREAERQRTRRELTQPATRRSTNTQPQIMPQLTNIDLAHDPDDPEQYFTPTGAGISDATRAQIEAEADEAVRKAELRRQNENGN